MSDLTNITNLRKLTSCKTLPEFESGVLAYWETLDYDVKLDALKILGHQGWADKFMDTLIRLYLTDKIDGLVCPDHGKTEFKKVEIWKNRPTL